MIQIKVQVRHASGQLDVLTVDADRMLIGSAAHCEIRLPPEEARPEHVRIDVSPTHGLMATALALDIPPTINGVPFQQLPLRPDAILGLGQTQLYISVAEVGGRKNETNNEGMSPITKIGALLCLVLGGYILYANQDEETIKASDIQKAPELWRNQTTQKCPQSGPQALAYAEERLLVANLKRERRPYVVQDGISAVPIFEMAAACLKAGGSVEDALQVETLNNGLREELVREYRTKQVSLEYFIRTEQWTEARGTVLTLLDFTEGEQGEYRNWLKHADRKLQLKAPKKEPEKKK